MVMMGKTPGPEWYLEDNLTSKAVSQLSRKVKVEVDPELDKRYFEKDELSARVEIITKKGDRLKQFVNLPSGDPLNPLTVEDIERKFRSQASYVLDDDLIKQVINLVSDFENLTNVKPLMTKLAGN